MKRTKHKRVKLRRCPECEGKRTEVITETYAGGGESIIQACSRCEGRGKVRWLPKPKRRN